jgi:hypothetical protein
MVVVANVRGPFLFIYIINKLLLVSHKSALNGQSSPFPI